MPSQVEGERVPVPSAGVGGAEKIDRKVVQRLMRERCGVLG
jgi:hypothetical protein